MKKQLLILLIFSTSFISYAQVTVGLVAEYSFNSGDATDNVGSNDGIVTSATLSADRFGNSNHAYYFDGASSMINLGTSSTLKPATGSISMWFNTDAYSINGTGYAVNPLIIAKNDLSGNSYFEGYSIYINSNNNLIPLTTESQTTNEIYAISANAYSLDNWHHVVLAYDDDSLWFYINGILENKLYKNFTSTFSTTHSVMLGNSDNLTNNRYFNGGLDDVRIYNRVLTNTEVGLLFNEPNPATLGLNVISNNESMRIYPNPANEILNIASEIPTTISIVDILGEEVYQGNLNSNLKIDVSGLSPGIYFIKDLNNERTVKFIKE